MIRVQNLNWNSSSAIDRINNDILTMSDAQGLKDLEDVEEITIEEIVNWAVQLIRSNERGYICSINLTALKMMRSDEHFRRFIQQSALILTDSPYIIWGSRLFSHVLPKQLDGMDLIQALAMRAEQEKIGIYLIGATSELMAAMTKTLQSQYPKLKVYGHDHGNGSFNQLNSRVAAIRLSGAQILLMAGRTSCSPKFLSDHWTDLGINLAIDLGNSCNGLIHRNRTTPTWIQELGLEWLYKFLQATFCR